MIKKRIQKPEHKQKVGHEGLCEHMGFLTAETYKMLRTKINLTVVQSSRLDSGSQVPEHSCRTIGITSALAGEGKSTTAINLAYTIAEANKRVLHLECDMRMPVVEEALGMEKGKGLSNILIGETGIEEVLQTYTSPEGASFRVISSGDIPPKPSELLESARMEQALRLLEKRFDYVIVDLPPLMVVTDALAVSPRLSGLLLVVREKYCDKVSLQEAINQCRQVGANILGIVRNSVSSERKKDSYYKRRKGKYYGGGG